jgi:hypothetical protein
MIHQLHVWSLAGAGTLAGARLLMSLRRRLALAVLLAVLRGMARAVLWLAILAVAWWAADRAAVLWVVWAVRWAQRVVHHQ